MTVDATKLTIQDAAGTTYPTFTGIDFPTTYFRGGAMGSPAVGVYLTEAFNVSSYTDAGVGNLAVGFISSYSSATALVPTYCAAPDTTGYRYGTRGILFNNGVTSPLTSASSLSWVTYEAFVYDATYNTTVDLADPWLTGLVILGAIA